jgi:nitrogen-specific signal transduction histidine kinase
MAARTNKIWHDESTRLKIKVGVIIDRLQRHIRGEIDMPNSAINAAAILLRKALPDIQQVTHTGHVDHDHAVRMIVTGVIRQGEAPAMQPNRKTRALLEAVDEAMARHLPKKQAIDVEYKPVDPPVANDSQLANSQVHDVE